MIPKSFKNFNISSKMGLFFYLINSCIITQEI